MKDSISLLESYIFFCWIQPYQTQKQNWSDGMPQWIYSLFNSTWHRDAQIWLLYRVANLGPEPCKNPTRTRRFGGLVGSDILWFGFFQVGYPKVFITSGFFGDPRLNWKNPKPTYVPTTILLSMDVESFLCSYR